MKLFRTGRPLSCWVSWVVFLACIPQAAIGAEKVLHWRFERSLIDDSPSGNVGRLEGSEVASYVEGRVGMAIRFGKNESVVCRSAKNIPTARGESWAINLWARLDEPLPNGAILGGFGGRAEVFDDKRFIICFNESVYFWEGNAQRQRRDLDSGVRFPIDGDWHMYTVTFDSGSQRLALSVDAEEIAIVQPVTTLSDALPEASVGGVPDFFGDSFAGDVDEFAIWVGSLTPQQIHQLYLRNTVVIPPPLWKRLWFVSLVSLLLGSGATVAWKMNERRKQQWRIRGLERESALERERARIAQDIHDDLGAGLTRVGLLGEMTADELENPVEARALVEEIASTARELVGRLDEIVWAVDPKNDSLEGLSSYLVRYAQEFLLTVKLRVRFDVPTSFPERNVAPDVRHHFLMAFKEGLNNLVKHAAASECVIRMSVKDKTLNLVLEDNGVGIAEGVVQSTVGNGLRNMQERMETVNGHFAHEAMHPQGTRLVFEFPLTP